MTPEESELPAEAFTEDNRPPANGATMQLFAMYQAGATEDDLLSVVKEIVSAVKERFEVEKPFEAPHHTHIAIRSQAMACAGTLLFEPGWNDPYSRAFDISMTPLVMPHSVHWWTKMPDEPKPCPRAVEIYQSTGEFILWYLGQLKNAPTEESAG